MRRSRDGVDAEFAAFVAAQWPPLVRLAATVTGSREAGEDAAQAALAAMWVRWSSIGLEARAAYARRCAVNAALAARRKASSAEVPLAELPEFPGKDPTGPLADSDLVARALQDLPPRARAVVVLRHLEDLSIAEVAATLGISTGAVKSLNTRGLERLRLALRPEVGQP